MRRTQNQIPTQAAVSSLESRVLLAGKVTATLKSGTLTITGDNGNNEIRIAPGLAGQIIVSETSGGTVNKSNNIVFDAASVKNIVVNPKMGHDVVHVSGVALTGYLSIDLSSGNNEADVVDSSIGGKLTIKGGNGVDEVTVERCTVTGELIGSLGNGTNGFGLAATDLASKSTITTGTGADHVSIDNTNCDKPIIINTSSGTDLVHFDNSVMNDTTTVDTSAGVDRFKAENSTFAGNVSVKLGDDNDQIELLQCDWGAIVVMDGGNGTDTYSHDELNIFAVDLSLLSVESTVIV